MKLKENLTDRKRAIINLFRQSQTRLASSDDFSQREIQKHCSFGKKIKLNPETLTYSSR